MKYTKFVLSAVFFLLLLVFAIMLAYPLYFSTEVETLKMDIEITDKAGFNVDTDAIHFGMTYPGGGSRRQANITNNFGYPVIISIKIVGNITPFVYVSSNDFQLMPGEMKVITYYADTKEDSPKGKYYGETKIIYKRVV